LDQQAMVTIQHRYRKLHSVLSHRLVKIILMALMPVKGDITTRNMSIRDENLNDEKRKCHRITAIL